jgi:hypothetical protein
LSYFIFQDNEIEEANKLLAANKTEEAITILSQVEATDKQFAEAQRLIKYTNSLITYNKGVESYNNSDFEKALKYFDQVEVLDSFPTLSSFKEEAIAGIELFKNLPGTYEGSNTPNIGGAYMIINTKMKILNNLAYTIQEQMTDTYAGGFYNDLYSGEVKPEITKFKSDGYGFILNLKPWGAPYKKNDFSVYFYRFEKYWRLQFNLTYGSTQQYTLNLFRETNQGETSNNDKIQNSSTSFTKESVRDFISSFINYVKIKNINAILDCYADEVDYFGKGLVDKKFIRKDKDDYYKKWDDVKYQMEYNSLSITDLPDNSKLAVFNFEYSVYSSQRNKQLGGIAQSKIKIRQGENGLEIYDEKQEIISKN